MSNLVGIFVSTIYLAITCEVCIAVGCVLEHMFKTVFLYAHLAYWQCDLPLQYGHHICLVIHAKFVYSDTGSIE